ncbi:MAG: T9SS type A sorting domain-containing protein [Bacteroidetes bacterium]|nr:T9SS type A sorting domain-containing protein [Bacteroidota bacterium]
MKKFLLFFGVILLTSPSFSQLLSWTPNFAQESTTPFVITVDATKGNQGLMNYATTTDVYVHIGVITNLSSSSSDWKYSKFTWGSTTAAANCTSLGGNKWSFTITGGLRTFFGISNGSETIKKIAILFRNGSGSQVQRNASGADMYIPVYTTALATRFTVPLMQPTYIPQPETITKVVGNTVAMTGVSNNTAQLKLYFNGSVIQTVPSGTTISATPTITASGNQVLVVEAFDGTTTKRDTIQFFVAGSVVTSPLPAGVRDGINYDATPTGATLVLYAPGKTRVGVIGDLPGSNWVEQSTYQMYKTPDGNRWWIHLTGLTAGTEYSFQYIVDGTLKIADPYAEKVQDPYNDQYITAATYANLKPYPLQTAGVVSILQTGQTPYNWHNTSFTRPDKRNTLIYEMLLRDFIAKHDWNTLTDTLNYIKSLGINVIELMPVNEFEGNNSWGYNPDFYFAADKYYGPANTMKRFVDSCHSRGIAVVMDIALNHSFGLSPMVQLYWDAANNRPSASNPWFNPVPKHAYNVGYDMNHESLATRAFVSRVVEHWLVNYKIDGFRFDLSKGFTQTQTCDASGNNCNVSSWSAYDASRIAIWKRYYDTLQLKSPGSYAILEHFADNSEETELSNYGFMLWGNMNYNYNQASMGYSTDWNFDNGLSVARGWANPYLVTYMESHDEERLMYKNLQFGNISGSYNIKSLATALKRMELCGTFFFAQPGPKMIWQFGELGYDYTINFCQNATINTNCRTDPKPITWSYFQNANRNNLYHVWSAMMHLRRNPVYSPLFISNNITRDLSGAFKWLKLDVGTTHLAVIGNFDVVAQTGSVTFPVAGTWYDYLNGTTINATGGSQSFTLQPGEYHVYTNQFVVLPLTVTSFNGRNNENKNLLTWTVNNEENLDYYELQRSVNGTEFTAINTTKANNSSAYTYTDDISLVKAPVYYYRLKMVNSNGDFTYSAVVRISVSKNGAFIEVSPNPFREALTVTIESALKDNASLVITDVSGKQLLRKAVTVQVGNNVIAVPETAKLATGIYVLTITTSQQKQSIRIVKGK